MWVQINIVFILDILVHVLCILNTSSAPNYISRIYMLGILLSLFSSVPKKIMEVALPRTLDIPLHTQHALRRKQVTIKIPLIEIAEPGKNFRTIKNIISSSIRTFKDFPAKKSGGSSHQIVYENIPRPKTFL